MNNQDYKNIIKQAVEGVKGNLQINQKLANMYRNEKDRKGFIAYLNSQKESNPNIKAEVQAVQNNLNQLTTQKMMLWGDSSIPPKEGMKTPEQRVSLKMATPSMYDKGLCSPTDALAKNYLFVVEERKKTEVKTFEQEILALMKKHGKSPNDLVQFIK